MRRLFDCFCKIFVLATPDKSKEACHGLWVSCICNESLPINLSGCQPCLIYSKWWICLVSSALLPSQAPLSYGVIVHCTLALSNQEARTCPLTSYLANGDQGLVNVLLIFGCLHEDITSLTPYFWPFYALYYRCRLYDLFGQSNFCLIHRDAPNDLYLVVPVLYKWLSWKHWASNFEFSPSMIWSCLLSFIWTAKLLSFEMESSSELVCWLELDKWMAYN